MENVGRLAAGVGDTCMRTTFRGGRQAGRPSFPISWSDLEELERYLKAAELHVNAETNFCKWDGRKVALAEVLDCMFSAERTRHAAQRTQASAEA
jgi:hypothetical protein